MSYTQITGMRSTRFPLSGLSGLGCGCGGGGRPGVSGLGCGCASALSGLGCGCSAPMSGFGQASTDSVFTGKNLLIGGLAVTAAAVIFMPRNVRRNRSRR